MVVCKVVGCPYKVNEKFCGKQVLGINQGGSCNQIYNGRGMVKPDWQQKKEEVKKIIIEEFAGDQVQGSFNRGPAGGENEKFEK